MVKLTIWPFCYIHTFLKFWHQCLSDWKLWQVDVIWWFHAVIWRRVIVKTEETCIRRMETNQCVHPHFCYEARRNSVSSRLARSDSCTVWWSGSVVRKFKVVLKPLKKQADMLHGFFQISKIVTKSIVSWDPLVKFEKSYCWQVSSITTSGSKWHRVWKESGISTSRQRSDLHSIFLKFV